MTSVVPRESPGRLFLRFLRFGLLAWGGPVAQIAMIRQELVEGEHWVSREQFNRILAVYQVLPGPEAHEMCVYFGMLSGGRTGGMLAGLAFMLPGFVLMFVLSALYASGVRSPLFMAFFLGIQPAVVALIVRAIHRIGAHALSNRRLWGIAIAAGVAQLLGTSFWITLPLAGLASSLASRARYLAVGVVALALVVGIAASSGVIVTSEGVKLRGSGPTEQAGTPPDAQAAPAGRVPLGRLFASGLRAGLLTFGGAYTVLPFLQHDAVISGRWMTNTQFLDGVALSGMLPAPFIIFSTFVGYLGGGPAGALILTIGIFLPAFGFTLVGHRYLERLIANRTVHAFLDGVTAGVVGLIAATAFVLLRAAVHGPPGVIIFGLALLTFYVWRARGAVAVVLPAAGAVGILFFR